MSSPHLVGGRDRNCEGDDLLTFFVVVIGVAEVPWSWRRDPFVILTIMGSLVRSRWAAIGAAVAVTLGGGGLIGVSATNGAGQSSYSPVTPVRILDTRGEGKVGALDVSGSGDPRQLKVTGTIQTTSEGSQTVVPVGATAVSLNVTAVATETNDHGGFVTVYPCGTRPNASLINFRSGETVANAVTVPISDDGNICIYVYGKAHLLADVVGFYQLSGSSSAAGPAGASAYEVWLEQGNTGSRDDFLASLVGATGPAGPSGSTDGSACTNAAGVAGTVVSGADSSGLLLAYCVTSPVGTITTFAGGVNGSTDGTGADARFNYPYGVAVDGDGNVYVADTSNHTIRKITAAGEVTTLAGTAGSSGSADGTGADARFKYPNGVAVDGDGNVYVADKSNHTVRKITAAGEVTTLVGAATESGFSDGRGPLARLHAPFGVAVDGGGNVYVADYANHAIRKVTPAD